MASIRSLADADVASADELLRITFPGGKSLAPRIRRYLAIQPDGWWVAEEGGAMVGMVGAVEYGAFAYVGLMGVRPDRQGRGIGRQLLAWLLARLEARGIACAMLDATEQGAQLYTRMGFQDSVPGCELQLPAPTEAPPLPPGVEVAADETEVAALDARLFGAERSRLWRWLLAAHPGRVLIARAGGVPSGYLCVQDDTVGPWGALTPDSAEALLQGARAFISGPGRILVPGDNGAARAFLEARGCRVQKPAVRHMRRGPAPHLAGWQLVYGKGSYCLG